MGGPKDSASVAAKVVTVAKPRTQKGSQAEGKKRLKQMQIDRENQLMAQRLMSKGPNKSAANISSIVTNIICILIL